MKCKNCSEPVVIRCPEEGLIHSETGKYGCESDREKVAE